MSKRLQIFPALLLCELFRWVACCFDRSAEWPGWSMTCSSCLGSLNDLVILPGVVPDTVKNQRAILPSTQLA